MQPFDYDVMMRQDKINLVAPLREIQIWNNILTFRSWFYQNRKRPTSFYRKNEVFDKEVND